MTISDEAVEAATQALRNAFDNGVGGFRDQARAALEAAAPHLTAGAKADVLEEAADVMINPFDYWGMNQRAWLRTRAVSYRSAGAGDE